MFLPFFFSKSKRLPTADSGGESFLFFLSESKSKRLPTADCGGESFLFFFFLRLSPKDSPLQILVGSLFFFFLSETKSERLRV